jgi:uncharacterized integral membrane protein
MRVVAWAVWLVVFLLLVAFAAKNAEPATVRFFFDLAIQAPLIVIVFASFVAGALLGAMAMIGILLRQRRQVAELRKKLPPEEPTAPPVAGL